MNKKKFPISAICKQGQSDQRIGFERRQFSYAYFYPERRAGIDRRGLVSAAHHGGKIAMQSNKAKWGYCN